MTPEALEYARTIFDFLQLRHEPAPADIMLVFGTNDTRVADFAADLYHRGMSDTLVVTGGMAHQGDLLATNWTKPEAEVYADILISRDVPRAKLLLEKRATNTAENVRFSRCLLENAGMRPRNLLMVTKPFMQRRVFATWAVEWPEIPATLASWVTTFDDYCTGDLNPEKVTNIMMGDLQRVWIYSARGWSAPQKIPASVSCAFRRLKELGFTKHLLADD
jgi:uncharacterized SAM-binding protein YcdF (DUF218 family)